MTQEDWTKMNKESHYNSLIKQDLAHRKLIKKLQLERDELKKQLRIGGVSKWVAVKENTPKENERVLAHNGYRLVETSWQEYTDQDEEWFKKRFTYWTKTIKPPCC